MIRARWQGFEVESGENPVSTLMTHWVVLKQAFVFVLFTIPLLTGLGYWLAQRLLKPGDRPMPYTQPLSVPAMGNAVVAEPLIEGKNAEG